MSSLGKIFFYAFLVLISGSLAAPQAWTLIHQLPSDTLHGLIGEVQRMPFHRYLSRSIQIAAIVLLWPLLRSLKIRSLEELGLFPCDRCLRDFLVGLSAGIPTVILLLGATLASNAFELRASWSLSILPKILLSSVVVAVLEEFLFRGVILGYLRQGLSRWVSIVISAIIFATLHFLNLPTTGGDVLTPHWTSGILALTSLRETFPPLPILAWAFTTLLVAGILLAWLTTRTGSLSASIALHGSWIIAQQLFSSMACYRGTTVDSYLPFFGPAQCHGAVPIGFASLICLLLAGEIVKVLLRYRPWPRLYTRVSW